MTGVVQRQLVDELVGQFRASEVQYEHVLDNALFDAADDGVVDALGHVPVFQACW